MKKKVFLLFFIILGVVAFGYIYGFSDAKTISFRGRDYTLSSGRDKEIIFKDLNNPKFGQIQSAKAYVKGHEVYVSEASIGSDYVPTVIFLRKNNVLFVVYALVGGP